MNLFLNPEHPPTLRALMVQLAWVTDGSFSYVTNTADGKEVRSYYFELPAPAGEGDASLRRLDQEAEELRQFHLQQIQEKMHAEIETLKEALTLSREEVIARYRGADDYLLLTLLDPELRGAAEFSVGRGIDSPPMITIVDSRNTSAPSPYPTMIASYLSPVPPEEKAKLRAAFGAYKAWFTEGVGYDIMRYPDGRVALKLNRGGTQILSDGRVGSETSPERVVIDVRENVALEPENVVKLRRLLGESVSDDEVDRLKAAAKAAQPATSRLTEAGASLSSRTVQELVSLPLPLAAGRPYALWEVQEAVAKASGLDVISDGFWQAGFRLPVAEGERLPAGPAVSALVEACSAPGRVPHPCGKDTVKPSWEWSDVRSLLALSQRGSRGAAGEPAAAGSPVLGRRPPATPACQDERSHTRQSVRADSGERMRAHARAVSDLGQMRYRGLSSLWRSRGTRDRVPAGSSRARARAHGAKPTHPRLPARAE